MNKRISKTLLILILIIGIIAITYFVFQFGYSYVNAQNTRLTGLQKQFNELGTSPINEATPGAVEVLIPRAASTSDIATLLKNKNLISNEMLFMLFSKFNGFDGNYIKGTHYLLQDMSYDEIMFLLTQKPKPIRITFPEGLTYRQMKTRMKEAGMRFEEAKLDSMIRRPNQFVDYDFVGQIVASEEREWLLQGYLWPDTYEFDPNADEETIIRTFLNNTDRKFKESNYVERAAKQGLTLDQVLTLASVVQTEGKNFEMAQIGRVFMNRIKRDIGLESCATINYLRSERDLPPILWVSGADIEMFATNPYNTYLFKGLPPGPINSPGTVAIEGILWPATNATWPNANNYLYFCAVGDGTNDFSTSLAEHQRKTEKYSAAWAAQTPGREGDAPAPTTGDPEPVPDGN